MNEGVASRYRFDVARRAKKTAFLFTDVLNANSIPPKAVNFICLSTVKRIVEPV